MIETWDKRKFFTHQNNYPQLVEFSKTFDVKISIVEIKDGVILTLEELASAICDPSFSQNTKYEIIETKNANQKSHPIKNYLEEKFKSRKPVSLLEMKEVFSDLNETSIRNYIRSVKTSLELQGYKFKRIQTGTYEAI
jgi:F0F1-type ATP synthase delta subunit